MSCNIYWNIPLYNKILSWVFCKLKLQIWVFVTKFLVLIINKARRHVQTTEQVPEACSRPLLKFGIPQLAYLTPPKSQVKKYFSFLWFHTRLFQRKDRFQTLALTLIAKDVLCHPVNHWKIPINHRYTMTGIFKYLSKN